MTSVIKNKMVISWRALITPDLCSLDHNARFELVRKINNKSIMSTQSYL